MAVTSITFDLTGSGNAASPLVLSDSGVTVSITSGLYLTTDFEVYENTPQLNRTADGLGMLNPYGDLETGIDGDGKREVAIFSFSEVVHVVGVTMVPLSDRADDASPIEDTNFRVFSDDLAGVLPNRQIDPTGNDIDIVADVMGIGADRYTDHFRITSITIEVDTENFAGDDLFTVAEGGAEDFDLLSNDAGLVEITSVDTSGLQGAVTIDPDGLGVHYDQQDAFLALKKGQTGTDTFSYTAEDADGFSFTASVTVRILGEDSIINGTSGAETIDGTIVEDLIQARGGSDLVRGNAGSDTVLAGSGNDTVFAGDGDDSVLGAAGDDSLLGSSGDDELYGRAGADVIKGGNDNDTVDGGTGTDRLLGGSGDDSILGGAHNDTLFGGSGNDTLQGDTGDDSMAGGSGDDTYVVDSVGDIVDEGVDHGEDEVIAFIDFILGANLENLTLQTGVRSGKGNELANRIVGTDLGNALSGFAGDDTLEGHDGRDRLYGGEDDDVILGGSGKDWLRGGDGRDRLQGDEGADTFAFAEMGVDNRDFVVDFVSGEDRIGLSAEFFGLDAGALTEDRFALLGGAVDSTDRIFLDEATGRLFYDSDGPGGASRTLIADFGDGTALELSDIFVF